MTVKEARYYAAKKKEALLQKPMELFYLGFRAGKEWQKIVADEHSKIDLEELTRDGQAFCFKN